MLLKILKMIVSWLVRHPKTTLLSAGAIATGPTVAGGVNAHKAKKLNKKARAIQQAALEKHEKEYAALQKALERLGQTEKTAIDSFRLFAEAIEKIQEKPKIRSPLLTNVKIPSYEPEEFLRLSTGLQTAVEATVVGGAGALAWLAAFGASIVVAAPAMTAASVVLCVKGSKLKKKAIKNKEQAEKMSKSVDEIVAFYSRFRAAADSYRESVAKVYSKYMECLNRMQITLTQKTAWKKFSREEKKNVENTVLLARLLFQMCKTKMIIQHQDEEKIETINSSELSALQKDAKHLLAKCA